MMSPVFTPAFSAGTAVDDLADQRAARTVEAERIGELRVHFLDLHADAAARDLAGAHELLAHVVSDVDRDRERQAHVAAAAAVDLRIDADDFAVEIEQRAAGIAGVHGDVGLDERHAGLRPAWRGPWR